MSSERLETFPVSIFDYNTFIGKYYNVDMAAVEDLRKITDAI